MAISGNFARSSSNDITRLEPVAPLAFPNARHSTENEVKTAWTPPPSPQGGGSPDAHAVDPVMIAKGVNRSIGRRTAVDPSKVLTVSTRHDASQATRNAARSFTVDAMTARLANSQGIVEGARIDASGRAHADAHERYIYPTQFRPTPQQGLGDHATQDDSSSPGAQKISGNAIARGGYSYVTTGQTAEYGVTGQRMSMGRKWVTTGYSSPALGAMYSKNTLRPVLQQTINVPTVTQGIAGPRNSGIPGNKPWISTTVATPMMRNIPPSPSDVQLAGQVQPSSTDYSELGGWM